jgi:hypothetical protein
MMTGDNTSEYPVPTGRSAVVNFLFPEPAERRPGAIVRWWESRRLPFNLIVGGSGLISLGLVALASSIPPNPHGFIFSWAPVVVYGVLANICFSLGPATELALEKLWGRRVLPTGPVLFRSGVMFSVGLTLVLPAILLTIGWILRVIGSIF